MTNPDARQNTQPSEEDTRMSKIDQDINKRVRLAIDEMNAIALERAAVVHGAWVARVAQEHLLMIGKGGTAKSLVARLMTGHIDGSVLFEAAFDETTDPAQVFGPPDIKAMVEDGKTRRVPTGMLPEATDAFCDEFFNANGPLLHSLQPILNERVFHNNGMPSAVPLRMMMAGTNKLNADADQAALWDRIHLRYQVDYLTDRDNQKNMVSQAIARMAVAGRGTTTSLATSKTLVTLDELDQAHKEALDLDVPDAVLETFFDLRDELRHGEAQADISDRRVVEGMAAVLANAWVRNHEEVKVADLDILANMWWLVQDQASTVRSVILALTNPGEKAAMDLLDTLDKLKQEVKDADASGMDPDRKRRLGVESVRNTDKLRDEAIDIKTKAEAAGTDTTKIDEVIGKADAFKFEVGKAIFSLTPEQMVAMTKA
jgi:MoxR-like ATPase